MLDNDTARSAKNYPAALLLFDLANWLTETPWALRLPQALYPEAVAESLGNPLAFSYVMNE